MALARVSEGPVQARLRHAHRAPCDVDATELERRKGLLKPMALLATENVLGGDAAVAEEDL